MNNTDQYNFQKNSSCDFFADQEDDHYWPSIIQQNGERYSLDEYLFPRENNQAQTGLNEKCDHAQEQEISNQQPPKQSEKHNYPKNFINLLKKKLKNSSFISSIEEKYLQYIQKNIKQSLKSLYQMIQPFSSTAPKDQQIKDKFIEKFEKFHQNLSNFSLMNREKKIQIINNCRQSIRNEICLKKDSIIDMAKNNRIQDTQRKIQFPYYVARKLKDLENKTIRGKDIKKFKKDSI